MFVKFFPGNKKIKSYAIYAENDYNYQDLESQLKFLEYEIQSDYYYASILKRIRNVENTAEGAYEAASIWCVKFEIPANKDAVAITRGVLARDEYWPEYYNLNPENPENPKDPENPDNPENPENPENLILIEIDAIEPDDDGNITVRVRREYDGEGGENSENHENSENGENMDAMIICAAYDGDGKALSIDFQSLTEDVDYIFSPDLNNLNNNFNNFDGVIKIMIFDSKFYPLCGAKSWKNDDFRQDLFL